MDKIKSILAMVNSAIASNKFFYLILIIFVFQASWMALSNNFGTPHDEKYHVGFIELYSQNLSPIISSQPFEFDYLGDATRTNSYFYHFLLGFPYKIASLFTNDDVFLVILMRFINVLMVFLGLIFIKKLLDGLTNNKLVANMTIFTLIMVPVFSFVASGVNYDNFIFLIISAASYLLYMIINKPKIGLILAWMTINAVGILTKFSYLPIAAMMVIGLGLYFILTKKWQFKIGLRQVFHRFYNVVFALLLVVMSVLIIERYVGNVVVYGSPMPDCSKVLSVERCSNWGPWQRNTELKEKNLEKARVGFITYAKTWIKTMISTSFGIYKTGVTKDPLPILWAAGTLIVFGCFLGILLMSKDRTLHPAWIIMIISISSYVLLLFYTNYKDYLSLGAPIAIQGRYLIITMPFLIGLLFMQIMKKLGAHKVYIGLLVVLWILMLLQGGLMTYLLSSDYTWWWPDGAMNPINNFINRVILGF